MAKKVILENWHLIVTADNWGSSGTEDSIKRQLQDIYVSIKRHIDDVGSISMASDKREVCEFCGYKWDPEPSGENGCCEKDEESVAAAKEL